MGILTVELLFSRAFNECFHEVIARIPCCLVGSDRRTASTAGQELVWFVFLFLSSFLPEQRASELKNIAPRSDSCRVPRVLVYNTAIARSPHEHAFYQFACLWRGNCIYKLDHREEDILGGKSLVPSRITYFLTAELTPLWLFTLEILIVENILLGEKGKYFLLRPCCTERFEFFPLTVKTMHITQMWSS